MSLSEFKLSHSLYVLVLKCLSPPVGSVEAFEVE